MSAAAEVRSGYRGKTRIKGIGFRRVGAGEGPAVVLCDRLGCKWDERRPRTAVKLSGIGARPCHRASPLLYWSQGSTATCAPVLAGRRSLAEPLTLYGISSANVRKVVIALEEIGLPCGAKHVAVSAAGSTTRTSWRFADMATCPWASRMRCYGMKDGEAGASPRIRQRKDRIAARSAVERAFAVINTWGKQELADRAAAALQEHERFLAFTFPRPAPRLRRAPRSDRAKRDIARAPVGGRRRRNHGRNRRWAI